MKNQTRQQLTLFLPSDQFAIETIRKKFNPIQQSLIAAHVTLCREDEIDPFEKIVDNLTSLPSLGSIEISFNPVAKFEGGKGVWLPGATNNDAFHNLRRAILRGHISSPRHITPHLTLMHPRNSTCTEDIFAEIKNYTLPTVLVFDSVSLIRQDGKEPWQTIAQFRI
jgi:hypothetical protein